MLYDSDTRRRSLYGKAGAFRLTSYGVEARMLSSAMYADEKLMRIVWNGILQAIQAYNDNYELPPSDYICNAINNSDVKLAQTLMKKYGVRIIE